MHRWGDPEYHVRRLDSRPTGQPRYEVAKFTDDSIPDAVYLVRGWTCNCPARGGMDHKHVRLVRFFRELKEPQLATFWLEGDNWRVKLWND